MKKIKIKRGKNRKFDIPKGQYGFVIGNGTSRKDLNIKELMDYGVLISCNMFAKNEFIPHALVCSDEGVTKEILKWKKDYPRANHMFSWFPKPGSGIKKFPTPEKFAAGPGGCAVAIETFKCPKVFMIGIDFFGFGSSNKNNNGKINNLYAGQKHYMSEKDHAPTYRNWQRRFQWLLSEYPWVEFYHVNPFNGQSPERLRGMPNFHQITYDNLMDHLENDVELVDILKKTPEDVELAMATNPDDGRAVLERQLVGQENIIFKDCIHPDDLVKIRLKTKKEFQSGNRTPAITIAGFTLPLQPVGLVKTPKGPQFLSDRELTELTHRETMDRFKMVKDYYAENPDKKLKAIDFESISDADKNTGMIPVKESGPLPPPPPPPPKAPPPPPPPKED